MLKALFVHSTSINDPWHLVATLRCKLLITETVFISIVSSMSHLRTNHILNEQLHIVVLLFLQGGKLDFFQFCPRLFVFVWGSVAVCLLQHSRVLLPHS